MMNKGEEYYKEVINDYIAGKATIKGEHPQEVLVAISLEVQ